MIQLPYVSFLKYRLIAHSQVETVKVEQFHKRSYSSFSFYIFFFFSFSSYSSTNYKYIWIVVKNIYYLNKLKLLHSLNSVLRIGK